MAQSIDGNTEKPARGYFRDKTVLITGASSGIGEDVALGFARQGAGVALLARRKDKLDDLAGRIEDAGGRALAIPCDVTKRSEVEAAIQLALRSFGHLDILVNSAGILIPAEVEKLKPEDLEKMMKVNVFGALYAIQAAIPIMRKQGAGSIINIASLAGRRGISPLGGYSATKFAMVGLTEALRIELFGSGIRVSLVMPGIIDTPMTSDASIGGEELGPVPKIFKMPVAWVTWAVLAAAAFGLTEVDVPPGAAVGEKLASLFPGVTDAFLSVGSKVMKAAARFAASGPKTASGGVESELTKEQATNHQEKAGEAHRKGGNRRSES